MLCTDRVSKPASGQTTLIEWQSVSSVTITAYYVVPINLTNYEYLVILENGVEFNCVSPKSPLNSTFLHINVQNLRNNKHKVLLCLHPPPKVIAELK